MIKIIPKYWETSFRWEFLAYPFFTSIYNLAAKKQSVPYHIAWDRCACNFANGHAVILLPTKKMSKAGSKIISDTLNGNPKYLYQLNKTHKQINSTTKACEKIRTNFDVEKFIKIWGEVQKIYSEITNIYFQFDFALDNLLNKLNTTNPKLSTLLQNYMFQGASSFLSQAETRIIKLEKTQANDWKKIYSIFMLEYGWFLNSYAGVHKITLEKLKAQAKAITPKKNKSKKIISLSVMPEKYHLLAKLAKTGVTFRDDKKKFQLIVMELMDKWLKAECKKRHWDFNTMRWLSIGEIFCIIKNNDDKLLQEAKQYKQKRKRIGLMTALGYANITKKNWNRILKKSEKKFTETIKGLSANPGICIGKVRIISNPNIQSIKKGEILITSMTRPEYLPLMNLAGAFVTDQGGITSHAAIVAREMKKPCIIGTKIATRVFKDGDIVEVNANIGTVKLISKN